MSKADEEYEHGYKILKRLFKLSDRELKNKLKSIFRNNPNHIASIINKMKVIEQGEVKRIIINEKYEEIAITDFDIISISAFGIRYTPAIGFEKMLIPFNKHFKL